MNIQASGNLKSTLETLIQMEELEQIVSEFYKLCADTWPVDLQFWTELSDEELEHKRNVAAMYRIVSEKPGQFEKGRPFNIIATQTMITGIRSNIEKLRKGKSAKTTLF